MKKFLALIAVGAIAFGLVGAAAATLTVSNPTQITPQQGTNTTVVGACAAGASIAYQYDTSLSDPTIAQFLVKITQDTTAGKPSCKGSTVALSIAGDGAPTIENYQVITSDAVNNVYTVGFSAQPTTLEGFRPTGFTVTVYK